MKSITRDAADIFSPQDDSTPLALSNGESHVGARVGAPYQNIAAVVSVVRAKLPAAPVLPSPLDNGISSARECRVFVRSLYPI